MIRNKLLNEESKLSEIKRQIEIYSCKNDELDTLCSELFVTRLDVSQIPVVKAYTQETLFGHREE